MKKLIFLLVCTSQLLAAGVDKISVRVFSEVRIEQKDATSPQGVMVKYGYKSEGSYVPQEEIEILTIKGIAELHTFHSSEEIHPFIGKPFYLVVLDNGKISGNVIKCYMGGGTGFYLIKGLEFDEGGSLKEGSGEKVMAPLSSESLNKIFQNIIAHAQKEKRDGVSPKATGSVPNGAD